MEWWWPLSGAPLGWKKAIAGDIVADRGGFLVSWVIKATVALFSLFLLICRCSALYATLGGFLSALSVLVSLCGNFLNLVARRGFFVVASPVDFPPAKVLVARFWLHLAFSFWLLPML